MWTKLVPVITYNIEDPQKHRFLSLSRLKLIRQKYTMSCYQATVNQVSGRLYCDKKA